jgi:hypothetical protein
MKTLMRIFLKLGVALVTFTLGVSIAAVYWLYRLPDASLPEVVEFYATPTSFPGLSIPVKKSSAQTEYFHVARSPRELWRFPTTWYTGQLKAMNELPLAALESEDESYRFLWLRSFHRPVAIHVWRTGDRYFMVVKRLNGKGGYDPGTFDLYWARSLSVNDWAGFIMHLEHSNYWLMPTKDDRMFFDGAQWILESYREGRYHVVDRQSPDDGAYRDACMYLLRQSGLLAEIPAREIY